MKSVKLCVPHVDSYVSDCIQWSILIMSLIPTDNKPLHIHFIMILKGNFHRPYFKVLCKMFTYIATVYRFICDRCYSIF